MTTETAQKPGHVAPDDPSATAAATPRAGEDAFVRAEQGKPKRTLGLWLVDTLIYPVVNNIGVFGISVFATYLTEHGWPKPANGKELASWKKTIGDAFQKRGKWVDAKLETKLGWSHKAAGMARMVFFSFFDGTFVAPFVKVLEDRREKMAMSIDSILGTKPADERVYEAEPKQSWRSVIEGRLLTSAIVVPTAVILNGKNAAGKSLNDFLFNDPGAARGAQIESSMPKVKSTIEKLFGKVHFPYFMKTVYFEAFYTSVCTAGLYLISRGVARKHPKKEHPHHAHAAHHPTAQPAADSADTIATEQPKVAERPEDETPAKPSARVNNANLGARLASAPATAELTA